MSDSVAIDWIEFKDSEDPRSIASAEHDGKIRFTFAPEAMALCLPDAGKKLTRDDQTAIATMLRLAYEQGKTVGKSGK